MNKKFAERSFANPDVDESIVDAVKQYFGEHGSAYPWDVICDVSESEGVSKKTARKAIRKLRMENRVVPVPPFTGEMGLAEDS